MEAQADYLSYDAVKKEAEKFNAQFNPNNKIPVEIGEIVEFDLDIKIAPIPDLESNFDIVALMSVDLSTIYVDNYTFENQEYRYRFSLAHEMGHYWLHRKFYQTLKINSVEEWISLYRNLKDEEYHWFEWQAYSFAGILLVPDFKLTPLFNQTLEKMQAAFAKARKIHATRTPYLDFVADSFGRILAREFNVSPGVVKRRILKDDYYLNRIPLNG